MDLGAMAMKECSSITGTSPSDCFCHTKTLIGWGVLSLSKDAVGVFYSPSRLGKHTVEYICIFTQNRVNDKVTNININRVQTLSKAVYIH